MYSIQSCALVGLEPHLILCEVDLAMQLPSFSLVGLPSSMTQESRERVRAAIVNSEIEWPSRKVTINLLPANLPKWGSHFELAMGLGVLAAQAELSRKMPVLAIGELSLSGEMRPCGWLPAIEKWLSNVAEESLRTSRIRLRLIAHEEDLAALEAIGAPVVKQCVFLPARTIAQAFEKLTEEVEAVENENPAVPSKHEPAQRVPSNPFDKLAQVKEEPLGVLAALVAIAGRHHCIFAGPQGMGKSMLIGAICEALPSLEENERVARAALLRTLGLYNGEVNRPIVHLQASASRAALEGALLNSGQALAGELTRAHLGVVVADELLEFRRDVIEAFRQPLDDGVVRLQRAKFRTTLPAKFQFLASTNLCPCGYWGLTQRDCRCSKTKRQAYQTKLSGPIADRFDLAVVVGQGRRSSGGVRRVAIPVDLQPLIDGLVDPSTWKDRLTFPEVPGGEDGVELWAQVWELTGCEASDRGRMKLGRVAKTLARLMGEPRRVQHLRLALLIRQDLDSALRADWERWPKFKKPKKVKQFKDFSVRSAIFDKNHQITENT